MLMSIERRHEVTEILHDWSAGDGAAKERLFPLVYDELRRQARGFLSKERAGHTLQPTALVHEAYLKLVDRTRVSWQNRARFFGIASQLMRRIVVDHAHPKNALARSDSAYALVRLGAAQAAEGKYREAVESQRQALDINKTLLAENPKNTLPRSKIGDGYNYIGEALEKLNDKNGALGNYRQAAAVREETSAADPNDAQFRQSVAESDQSIGRIYSTLAAESAASNVRLAHSDNERLWYERSLEIWRQLNSRGALSAADAGNINLIQSELEKIGTASAKFRHVSSGR